MLIHFYTKRTKKAVKYYINYFWTDRCLFVRVCIWCLIGSSSIQSCNMLAVFEPNPPPPHSILI
jgi:hypothetical protein